VLIGALRDVLIDHRQQGIVALDEAFHDVIFGDPASPVQLTQIPLQQFPHLAGIHGYVLALYEPDMKRRRLIGVCPEGARTMPTGRSERLFLRPSNVAPNRGKHPHAPPLDLITEDSIVNPYFRKAVDEARETVFEDRDAAAAA